MNQLGNLDSKNSLEIMNIIKSISKEKLVILVTHEEDLAKFYATRIIEIQDGTIKNDYINEHANDLDYQVENKIYLKDFKNCKKIIENNIEINTYTENKEEIKLNIIVKNDNIYIQSYKNEKLQVVDDSSNIEIIDDHYKKINKETINKYEFNFDKVIDNNFKKKYSSINNIFSTIIKGFAKILDYTVLKKFLLFGFLLSGIFIMYAISSIFATLEVRDEDFIKYNPNYLLVDINQLSVDEFLNYENNSNISYMLPGNSQVNFELLYDEYYQSSMQNEYFTASIASISLLNSKDIVYGKMPENDFEVVVDKFVLNNIINGDSNRAKTVGLNSPEDFINKKLSVGTKINNLTIVGLTDLNSPSIYVNKNMMINLIEQSNGESSVIYLPETQETITRDIYDFKLFESNIVLERGKMPENDYEVIVNISNRYNMPLNRTIDTKVNDTNLKVVGYYSSPENINYYLVNNNTIKYNLINQKQGFAVATNNKSLILEEFKNNNFNIIDSYENSKEEYIKSKEEQVKNTIIFAIIIIIISLIEMFLMSRSSFLSRIKEIGILRAIGVKKRDIYKMFMGEIIAITTLTSLTGIILMAYILNAVSSVEYMSRAFMINPITILCAVVLVYIFNLFVGLIPVHHVIKKRPAQILSRHDI